MSFVQCILKRLHQCWLSVRKCFVFFSTTNNSQIFAYHLTRALVIVGYVCLFGFVVFIFIPSLKTKSAFKSLVAYFVCGCIFFAFSPFGLIYSVTSTNSIKR